MCKERKQSFRVCYLVRARAMAQMARVNFVCVTVIICLHSNLKVLEKCTKNLIGHSRLAFNNHESNIDC